MAGGQINPIDVNFYLQKHLEIFDKKSADKIQSKYYNWGKSALLGMWAASPDVLK